MMLSDTLNAHLEEVDSTAAKIYDRLISQLAKQEGITEQMKATNQMEWVQQMNNIRNRAAEAVRKELLRRIANAIRISHPVGTIAHKGRIIIETGSATELQHLQEIFFTLKGAVGVAGDLITHVLSLADHRRFHSVIQIFVVLCTVLKRKQLSPLSIRYCR